MFPCKRAHEYKNINSKQRHSRVEDNKLTVRNTEEEKQESLVKEFAYLSNA